MPAISAIKKPASAAEVIPLDAKITTLLTIVPFYSCWAAGTISLMIYFRPCFSIPGADGVASLPLGSYSTMYPATALAATV